MANEETSDKMPNIHNIRPKPVPYVAISGIEPTSKGGNQHGDDDFEVLGQQFL